MHFYSFTHLSDHCCSKSCGNCLSKTSVEHPLKVSICFIVIFLKSQTFYKRLDNYHQDYNTHLSIRNMYQWTNTQIYARIKIVDRAVTMAVPTSIIIPRHWEQESILESRTNSWAFRTVKQHSFVNIYIHLCKGSFQKWSAKNIWNFPCVGWPPRL